jgi:S1-C subfamily serine protease
MEKRNTEANQLALLSEQISGMIEQIGKSIVAVHGRERIPSTGFHLGDGYLVTASHAIKRTQDIRIGFAKDADSAADFIGRDPATDLALLRISTSNLSTAEAADANLAKAGQMVIAAGFGHGKTANATLGILTAINGQWRTWRGGKIDQLIQPDITFPPGFSGGPLLNSSGQVLGINTSGLSRRQVVTIPLSTVNRIVEQLKKKGRIAKGYLGVAMYPLSLPHSLQQQFNLPQSSGLIILSVEPQSPANQAGLLIGDVLVKLNDSALHTMEDVQAVLEPESVGKTVKISVIRGGTSLDLPVVVGERPH